MRKLEDLEKNLDKKPEKKRGNDLLSFFLGIVLLAAGLFLVLNYATVYTSWYSWRIGGFAIPSGLTAIPLLIGIGMLFYRPKSVLSWIVTVIGAVCLLITLIMSVRISFSRVSLFGWLIMFGMIAGGIGLLLKSLFWKRDSE